MTFIGSLGGRMLRFVAMIIFVTPICGIKLDVCSPVLPASIDVLNGTFNEGGVYTLIRPNTTEITHITCRGYLLDAPMTRMNEVKEMFVQKYVREGESIINITYIINVKHHSAIYKFYKCYGPSFRASSLEEKRRFVGGPIAVSYDMNSSSIHPIVFKNILRGKFNGVSMSVNADRYNKRDRFCPTVLHFSTDNFLLSPLTLVHKSTEPENIPTTLSSHANLIRISDDDDEIVMYINGHKKEHKVRLPTFDIGIFTPRCMMEFSYGFRKMKPRLSSSSRLTLNIDISKPDNEMPDVVILNNLKVGDWLYTQYSLVVLRYWDYIRMSVINSEYSCVIYRPQYREMLSHVEVFRNLKGGIEYVVVNINVAQGYDKSPKIFKAKMKIYKRICNGNECSYDDLSNYWLDPYQAILDNAPKDLRFVAPGGSDIIAEQSFS
ncbi:spherical body protein, putative [Babesia ovis]|uniref:Spherical body protein, putative n=1 Tax=Babesia ovis TaxID=5869 RepID=A0A9W5TDM2_BABOV|nr:spherical body protein, putative [Babesia ovis]